MSFVLYNDWLALSQKYVIEFCSCCQRFASNVLSYRFGYAIYVHNVEEVVTLLDAITDNEHEYVVRIRT